MFNEPGPLDVIPLLSTEIQALRCLEKGVATDHQQRLALQAILKKLARTYDLHYLPSDERGTVFMQGRAFVGQRIMHAIRMDAAELRKLEVKETKDA